MIGGAPYGLRNDHGIGNLWRAMGLWWFIDSWIYVGFMFKRSLSYDLQP